MTGRMSAWLRIGVAALAVAAAVIGGVASVGAQRADYPQTLIPPGKGPFTFPAGYQTPWDKIEILVTEKMSPNLFVLHGSEGLDPAHPDASGGRAHGALRARRRADGGYPEPAGGREDAEGASGRSPTGPSGSWSTRTFTATTPAPTRSSPSRAR